MSRSRVVFYCHNTYGVGHVVRSLRLADAAKDLGLECAVLTGCQQINALNVPAGVEVHQLSPAFRTPTGRPVPLPEDPDQSDILKRRSKQILKFCSTWRPDCLVADLHPLGLGGELVEVLMEPTCSAMKAVWGLPYAEGLGTRTYRNPSLAAAYRRYEDLLVYTDPRFDDILSGQDATSLPARKEYVGIVIARPPNPTTATAGNKIVALCGGGYGGAEFYQFVLNAAKDCDVPLRIVAGPRGNAALLRKAVAERRVELLDTATLDQALEGALFVISRAGYNTAFYLLQTSLPIIFVPQGMMHDDQPRRALKLEQFINVWNVNDNAPNANERLKVAIGLALQAKHVSRDLDLDLKGAANAARYLTRLVHRSNNLPA